jgi:hypothetical protein
MSILSRIAVGLTLPLLAILAGCGGEPATDGAEPQFRRLTEAQYRNTIADVFGNSIVLAGRFDPLERIDGLLAVGASEASITPAGLERYETLARSIAMQVIAEPNRDILVPCRPAATDKSDSACAELFLSAAGRFLFRSPLGDSTKALYLQMANEAGDRIGDFYQGLAYSLAGMLVSPKFLFISESVEPDPDNPGGYRLDGYSKAARLSFLLWNTTPDDTLLSAAEAGELNGQAGIQAQVERMLSSPRAEDGVRAFFADMLEFERFETMEKDPVIYPAFGLQVAEDAREQTLRTLTHLLMEESADYREIFTSRKTFVSGALGFIYKVPVENPSGWVAHEFDEGQPWAGIHTHLSFQSLFSHPGKSSPTLRGKAVRERLLCQKVPDPPGDVDFTNFNSDTDPVNRTARQRLAIHNIEPSCAGCHKIMDPIGLAMEQFDGAGQFRTTENDSVIDPSGELDGTPFTDAVSLGDALYDNPAATECVANRLYAYAAGRSPRSSEREWLGYLHGEFEGAGYRFPELLRSVLLSEAFYRVVPAERAGDSSVAMR